MDRQRRATNENKLWANPCDYTEPDTRPSSKPEEVKKLALQVVKQAKNTLASALEYKDAFAKLHSFTKFNDLLNVSDGEEWLRKFPWYRDEVLPKHKKLYSTVPEDYVLGFMDKMNVVLPAMYKGLKMVVAGLYAFSKDGLNDIISDESLKESINHTMRDVRAILCHLNEIVITRELEIMPLLDSEIPDFTSGDRLSLGLLVYRDTLNYLEYLIQVFDVFASSPAA